MTHSGYISVNDMGNLCTVCEMPSECKDSFENHLPVKLISSIKIIIIIIIIIFMIQKSSMLKLLYFVKKKMTL